MGGHQVATIGTYWQTVPVPAWHGRVRRIRHLIAVFRIFARQQGLGFALGRSLGFLSRRARRLLPRLA
jgi:hypothetical protein